MNRDTDTFIEEYVLSTLKATQLLHSNQLFGQLLVIIYSSIESMGLLDSPPTQTKATGETFKNWAKKHLLKSNSFDFNEVDLWAARCSVLHTFTSESDLSNDGKARQIQYYSGPKDAPLAQAFLVATKAIDNGAHVPAHVEDLYFAFLEGLKNFAKELSINCQSNQAYELRLRKVLQSHSL
jgi:hypothetical protein